MKKTIPLIIVIIVLSILLLITNNDRKNIKTELNNLQQNYNTNLEELTHYKDQIDRVELQYGRLFFTNIYDIKYKDYKKMSKEESFILVITMQGCSHCETYLPVLDKVLFENNLKAYHLDLVPLTREEYNKVIKETGITGTPTTLIYKDGELKDTLSGSKNNREVLEFLKENGYEK